MKPCLLALLILPLMAGCGSTKGYPSLERRPYEQAVSSQNPAPAAPKTIEPISPALQADLDRWLDQASKAHAAFTAKLPATQHVLSGAKGAAAGSDSWSRAAIALADLESTRSQLTTAITELDQIFIADRIAHAVDGGGHGPEIAAVRARAEALMAEEDRQLAPLRGLLQP